MRLKTDTPQRSRQPELAKIASWTLKRGHQRTSCEERSGCARLDPLTLSSERRFDKGANLRILFRDDADRFRRQTGSPQRVNALLRPLHVLKHTNGEPARIDVNHGDVIYQGPGVSG